MAKQKKSKTPDNQIAANKKARFEYFLEETFEAGIALEGWEVKSLRAGNLNLSESYVQLKNGEAFLFGAHITPMETVSTHVNADPTRTRKLLLNKRELARIFGAVNRQGYTCIPVSMYWSKKGLAKLQIALARGKQSHDKRATQKDRDWNRDKQRIMRSNNK